MASTIIPPSKPHTHTVIFLHGRGDSARNFAFTLNLSCDSRGRTLIDAFASFRWVFPQAPMRQCASSPDIFPQWFDVWNVQNFAEREELQAVGLKEVVPVIRDIIADEAAQLGGRWDRIILAGISMGAATILHVLFNLNVSPAQGGRLAAFMGFSCRCPFPGRTLSEIRSVLGLEGVSDDDSVIRNTPILLEHCIDDPVVSVQGGRELKDVLDGYGAEVMMKEYLRGGHWFHSPTGMDDAIHFLNMYVLGEVDD